MKYRVSTPNECVWCITQLAKLGFDHSIGRTHSWRFSIFYKILMYLLAKQHRAISSETPTHNSKNRQASNRPVLPSVPFVYRRPVAPEKNSNSTFSGSSQPCVLFTVSPTVEHMRSDWACVAGIARTPRATRARYANSMACCATCLAGCCTQPSSRLWRPPSRWTWPSHRPSWNEHLDPYGVNNAILEAVGHRVAITAAHWRVHWQIAYEVAISMLQCRRACEGIRSPQRFTAKGCIPHKKRLPTVEES